MSNFLLMTLMIIVIVNVIQWRVHMKNKYHLLAISFSALLPFTTLATTYPVTVTDIDGQKITLKQEPKRVVLQDGRDILTLALLDRSNPFERVVAWNNNLKKSDPQTVA